MPDNFIDGNDAFVTMTAPPAAAVSYHFRKWSIPIEGGVRKFFAFGSKFQRTLPGGISSQVILEGAYNQGNMPLALHQLYAIELGWEVGISIEVTGRLANIEFSNEIGQGGEPGGQARCTFESDGSFDITFL
jgi:hypothetical protein